VSKIKIILNGEEKIIPCVMSIGELILLLEFDIQKIAIEKDLEIINPDQFDQAILNEGSKIEIVHFIGGG
jgi:thiamine biosynthesis protein ThiS